MSSFKHDRRSFMAISAATTLGAILPARSDGEDTAGEGAMVSHNVLENIRNLVTYPHGQNYLFNGCMHYLMECLGEDRAYDYWFFSGVTGDSFTQIYRTTPGPAVSSLSIDAFDHALAKKAFDGCGYAFTLVSADEIQHNAASQLQRILASINSGVPVITKGFGEHTPAFSIICGFEDNGNILLGLMDDRPVVTRSEQVLERSDGLLYVGQKKDTPSLATVHREAVLAIPELLTRSAKDGLLFGKPAFEAWAAGLLDDPVFEGKDDAQMDEIRWKTHCTHLCIAGTNGCARGFLEKALELCPDMSIISSLQPIYERMQQLFEEIQTMQGDFWVPYDTLRNGDKRRDISKKVLEFCPCCDDILATFADQDMVNGKVM